MYSHIPKVKGAVPSINTSNYGASEAHFDTQEIKKLQTNNLKILIPAVTVIIGVAVVIFGSGMMHPQPQILPLFLLL